MFIAWHIGSHGEAGIPLDPTRPIVCFGDSITSMDSPNGGYPRDLAKLVPAPVVNMGTPGMTAAKAVARIPEVLRHCPQAVVLEVGGNDYLEGAGEADVRENLVTMIVAFRDAGAEVVLVEVPRGFVRDPYGGLERRLARKYDLALLPDTAIRRLVLFSPGALGRWTGGPHLSEDGLHPNRHGDEMLARYVGQSLNRVFSVK